MIDRNEITLDPSKLSKSLDSFTKYEHPIAFILRQYFKKNDK